MSRKIGALWIKKSQDGRNYLSGVIQDLSGDINIAVFKNDKKEADKQPDYNIVLSERSKPAPQVEGAPGPDDIPF
ncbi:MAG: DUF736 domain-containing protein [Patescibacteria group bacterium]|nr:DUF736 domain-containing protein [Patescibacteria group bacterium]